MSENNEKKEKKSRLKSVSEIREKIEKLKKDLGEAKKREEKARIRRLIILGGLIEKYCCCEIENLDAFENYLKSNTTFCQFVRTQQSEKTE